MPLLRRITAANFNPDPFEVEPPLYILGIVAAVGMARAGQQLHTVAGLSPILSPPMMASPERSARR